jgi:hypothetical protein
MDITNIVTTLATGVIAALLPVLVAFIVAYARRAVAAFETSKYAAAYATLDPTLRDAIDTAAAEAMSRAVDAADEFSRDDVELHIVDAVSEAQDALEHATGVRVDLQPQHIDSLINVALEEVNTTLDALDVDLPAALRSDGRDLEDVDTRFRSYNEGTAPGDPRAGSAWSS